MLRTAAALADERGLEALTMRSLAKELDIEAMSLYNHVASKGDLLDGMIELVFSEIEPPAADGDWTAELRKRAVSTRDALLRHRWAVGERFALQQTDMSSQTAEDFAVEAQRQMVDYADALADYPNLVEVVGGYIATAGYDYDREFLFGFDVILDGLAQFRERAITP